jgi:hypothetical protein
MIHYHPKSQLLGQNRGHPSLAHASSTFAQKNIASSTDHEALITYMWLYFLLVQVEAEKKHGTT